MSHTPGPWKTGREDLQGFVNGEPTTYIYHATKKDGVHLGQPLPLTIGRAEGDNNKANARLIAAAPELLAACKAALAEMVRTSAPRNEFTDAVDMLDEAITKAEGKS